MNTPPAYRVVSAEKLSGGVVVTFGDGTSAAYSASLLRAALVHAEALCSLEKPEIEEDATESSPPLPARAFLQSRQR